MEVFGFDTCLGHMTGWADQALVRLDLSDEGIRPPASGLARETCRQVLEYLDGQRKEFSLPVFLRGTAFQQSVWKALMTIPWGEVRTYTEIADLCGHRGAVRAVGSACGKNPILLIIPCHRVVASHGPGGFRCGLEVKEALLDLEGRKK